MKELDLLLDGFIKRHADAINRGEWPDLEALLDTEDDILWDWMQNPDSAQPEAMRRLVHEIRDSRGTP